MTVITVWLKRALLALVVLVAVAAAALYLLWHDRTDLASIDWPLTTVKRSNAEVSVTWLGVGTLLFDDGDTQILFDGFFSRPTLADSVFDRPVGNDAAAINHAMNEFRMRRLAAIIPLHSHFDHALDIGAIANRSSASVLGSASSAQIARGAGVPDEQIIVASSDQRYRFGDFTVRMLPIPHAPIGWFGSVPFDGRIEAPLELPQPVSRFRVGKTWSVIVEHPAGTALVQGSAGFSKYALRGEQVDAAFLTVGMLDSLGEDYAELYWQHTVTAAGARRVFPIHFDDYTRPFGDVAAMPSFISNIGRICDWFEALRERWDADTELELPRFGVPIDVYADLPERA